tara:strand:+ start:45 stop:542 length:498 start_codon:yes stop_codon:yes gene_type:complete
MKNTNWNQIESGQIVKFRYKGLKSKRSLLREVIVLDPRFLYRKKSTGRIIELFIGLEIDNQEDPSLRPMQVKDLLEILGRAGEDASQQSGGEEARMKTIYQELKPFLKRFPIFRTYLLRNCRRYRVFLQDKEADLNKFMMKKIADEIVNDDKNPGVKELEATNED